MYHRRIAAAALGLALGGADKRLHHPQYGCLKRSPLQPWTPAG